MLASDGFKAFDDEDWLFELKYDGFRIIAYIEKSIVKLRTRNNKDYTKKFPPVVEALSRLKGDAIIDGEVVVLREDGTSDFNALQNWRSDADGALYYYAFDLLYLNGKDLMSQPLHKRKSILYSIIPSDSIIRYCDEVEHYGKKTFDWAKRHGLEGIIAKRMDSVYTPGIRTKQWLKIKTTQERDFVIAGYTLQDGPGIARLILAGYRDSKLHYAGDVGTGWSDKEAKEILAKIKVFKKCPLAQEPVFGPGRWGRKVPTAVVWCKPDLVCTVKYLERTRAGELRHASFLRLRNDIQAGKVEL